MSLLQDYYEQIVIPLEWAVLDIQRAGILVDVALMKRYHAEATTKQEEIVKVLAVELGFDFNPNSSKQCIDLYNSFGLDLGESSDKLALLKCLKKFPEVKPLVEAILDYRTLGKQKGTYLNVWLDSNNRAHSEFRVYGTVTWRLSSRDIDLQNMPRHPKHGINIKDIYIAPPGSVLVELDYSQLEYRIPAYASRCKKLIDIFESGQNPHFHNASVLFERPITTKGEEYDFSKRFKYAEGYGGGAITIANHMLKDTLVWVEPKRIKDYLDKMKSDTPEIYQWRDVCWDQAKKESVLYEGFGLPRYLYGHVDDFRGIGYSWPTQATASGIINRSLVRIHNWLSCVTFCRCICQVHDSLLFEVDERRVDKFVSMVRPMMEQPVTIFGYKDVMFPVEAKVGKRWGSMEVYK